MMVEVERELEAVRAIGYLLANVQGGIEIDRDAVSALGGEVVRKINKIAETLQIA
jgi:hypothetical protein